MKMIIKHINNKKKQGQNYICVCFWDHQGGTRVQNVFRPYVTESQTFSLSLTQHEQSVRLDYLGSLQFDVILAIYSLQLDVSRKSVTSTRCLSHKVSMTSATRDTLQLDGSVKNFIETRYQ